jgi:hypothetical protein
MPGGVKIEIQGLREFQKSLREMDANLPKQLRLALNDASKLVIDYAQPRFPHKTGAAAASLKARSSQREARVALGGRRAAYAPWLDFGGQGKVAGRPASRPYISGGRYVYKGLEMRHEEITKVMSEALARLGQEAGLAVT